MDQRWGQVNDRGDEINNMGNNLAKGINVYFQKKRIIYIL